MGCLDPASSVSWCIWLQVGHEIRDGAWFDSIRISRSTSRLAAEVSGISQQSRAEPGAALGTGGPGGNRGRRGGDRLLRGEPGRRALCLGSPGRLLSPAAARRRAGDGVAADGGSSAPPVAPRADSRGWRIIERDPRLYRGPGGRGARHRFGHRRLPLSSGLYPSPGPAGQDRGQRHHARDGRIRRARGPHRPDRGRLRLPAGKPAAVAARRAASANGRRHGRGHRRDLPGAAGGDDLRGRGHVPLARVRGRSHHPHGDRQRHFLLRLRRVQRLGALVHDPRPHVQQPAATGAVSAPGDRHGPAGHALYADLLRLPAVVPAAADPQTLPPRRRGLADRAGGGRLVPFRQLRPSALLAASPSGGGERRRPGQAATGAGRAGLWIFRNPAGDDPGHRRRGRFCS